MSLLFVLFGPDIVALKSAPDSINPIIDALLLASMAFFTSDVLLSVVCRQKVIWMEVPCHHPSPPLICVVLTYLGSLAQ